LLLYAVLSVAYGLYIKAYEPAPDPVTRWVTGQSNTLLRAFGESTSTVVPEGKATVSIAQESGTVLSVFEGCNGLNVMIVFLSFLFGFSGLHRKFRWFVPLGLGMIHAFNLGRIILLYYVTLYLPNALYFTHKFLFTAFIFIAVFILWYVWVMKLADKGE
jgi:exosortase family protein XrtF